MNLPPISKIADLLGGEAFGDQVRCPGPGHSCDDRSLSVRPDCAAPDGFLVHSFAGDDAIVCKDFVRGKLGLERHGATQGHGKVNGKTNGVGTPKRIIETYDYVGPGGELRFQVCRFEPKDFRQRRPNGKGGWIWNMKGVEHTLYRQAEIIEAIASNHIVAIVEGERDVNNLAAVGVIATCNAGGAGKWRAEYNEVFRGADVILVPDNDDAGRGHVHRIGTALSGVAERLRILALPDLPLKGDASDWLAAGGTREQWDDLVRQAPDWQQAGPTPDADGEPTLSDDDAPGFSEEWLALLFAKVHANELRHVAKFGQWFLWNGSRWSMDETRKTFSLARDLCRQSALKLDLPGTRRSIASARTRAAVVSLAGEDRRLVATSDQWDSDPWLLNTPGGVVDLHTGKLRPHKLEDYMTKQTAVSPGGDCPLWKKFLKEITAGDGELQRYLQRIAGYALTGDTSEQELFFCYGEGNNGKGVFVGAIAGILADYHVSTSIETFTVSNSDRHPTELARLWGARLVTSSETEENRRWAEARIKELTGGDRITARFMRQDFFEFTPQFKLLFSGNHMPTLRSVNKAITRRFNRIPFSVTISDDRVDTHLADKLRCEWPGILQWMVDGCLEWQRIGLAPPAAVTMATETYLEGEDIIGTWLGECCQLDANGWESSTGLYKSWQPWAEERQEWVGSVRTLSAKLEDRGFVKHNTNVGKGFRGLRLKYKPF
jgi:putative DNA primase/helicase